MRAPDAHGIPQKSEVAILDFWASQAYPDRPTPPQEPATGPLSPSRGEDALAVLDPLQSPTVTLPVIHTTDRQVFKQCRQLWDFSSNLRMNLEPIPTGPNAFWFGAGIHEALAAYYLPTDIREVPKVDLIRGKGIAAGARWKFYCRDTRAFEVDSETYQLGQSMLDYYVTYWAPENDDFEVLWVEKELSVPIPGMDAIYSFKCDGVVRHKDRLFILEHKTASKFNSSYDYLAMDSQVGSYVWGVQEVFGYEVEGVIYTILKKKAPLPLRRLKDGTFSKDKKQDTTFEIAKEQLEQEYGKVPPSYNELLNYLRYEDDGFVHREVVRRNHDEIARIGLQIQWEASDMLNNPSIYRSDSAYNCNGCAFYSPCLAKWEGTDYMDILNGQYQERNNANS